jgi:catechol 2,3-dioxygenase-like lactoylglutathione lyase family enzyme
MGHIEAMDTVIYETANMKASVAFYEGVLGLTLKQQHGIDYAEYEVGGGVDLAIQGELARKPEQGGATAVLRTADLAALREHLTSNDVKCGVIDDMGGALVMQVEDPDMNRLFVIEHVTA